MRPTPRLAAAALAVGVLLLAGDLVRASHPSLEWCIYEVEMCDMFDRRRGTDCEAIFRTCTSPENMHAERRRERKGVDINALVEEALSTVDIDGLADAAARKAARPTP